MIGILLAAAFLAQNGQARAAVEPVSGWSGWKSNGPDGGSVMSLSSSAADPSTIYAATTVGLFKTTDGGVRWDVLDRPDSGSVTWVGAAQSDPSIVYALSVTVQANYNFVALYRSDDAGATWLPILNNDWSWFFRLTLDPSDSQTLYATPLFEEALKSTDGGRSWSAVLDGSPSSIVVDETKPSTLYANLPDPGTRNDRLQKSLDGGATWMSAGIVSEGEWVAVDPLDSRILYGVGSSFQRSDDGGATIASGTTSPGQVLALATSAGTPPRLYADVVEAAFRGLYVSADRGVSWSRTTSIP